MSNPLPHVTTIRTLLVAMLLFAGAFAAHAQQTVTGVVTDGAGNPIPGAVVMIKGTNTGTSTDESGKYSITALPSSTLV
ncbi:MAG: carboxypeptidase-like regulatory domain-containing protein, partial [Bacteroidales bacterium]|nr:carboxypeptidase-like regulatory domain-containing protein [Bacteroidales bacterium]